MTIAAEQPRDTPLEAALKARIRQDGPISVGEYMAACLNDPAHGYYRRRPAIGTGGDFVTAPEISQVFGELIGLWCAVVWRQMKAPARLNLIELGPGRGTMMRDCLRASRIVPVFHAALAVHLVDRNETLRDTQRATLADSAVPIQFHTDAWAALTEPTGVPAVPAIVLANEFLDALPIEQFHYVDGQWHTRAVSIDSKVGLSFSAGAPSARVSRSLPPSLAPEDGNVFEISDQQRLLAETGLRARAGLAPLAALFIDYGHMTTGFGDTLQGVAGHSYVSPLHAPGETDLSAQVDFQQFSEACTSAGLATDGPVPQAEFLGRLGVVERASRLMADNPAKAGGIEAAVQRLIAPSGMGSRFLALGVRSPGLPPLPGLA